MNGVTLGHWISLTQSMPRSSRGLLANYYSIATSQYRLHSVRLQCSRFHHYLPLANLAGEIVRAISLASGRYGLHDQSLSTLALGCTHYSNENPCYTSRAASPPCATGCLLRTPRPLTPIRYQHSGAHYPPAQTRAHE